MNNRVSDVVFDDPSAFRTTVRMAAAQIGGLDAADLAAALAFEVEPFSGIPAGDADVSFRAVADPDSSARVFDVAVRRRAPRRRAAHAMRAAACFAALVAAVLALDASVLLVRRARVDRAFAERRPLEARVAAVRRAAADARERTRILREERAAAEAAQRRTAELRAAYPAALAALSSACGERAVLREIVPEGPFSMRVRAIAVSAAAAADAMVAMTAAAAACGWRFEPGDISTRGSSSTATFEGGLRHD